MESGSDELLASVLDLDEFFTESVARTLQGSFDSFSACGNNFYLYNDPAEDADPDDLHGTWRIIPWDFDLDLARWGTEAAVGMDPWKPWVTSINSLYVYYGDNYADPIHIRNQEMGRDVAARIADLLDGPLDWTLIDQEISDAYALIAPHVEADPLGYGQRLDQWVADTRLTQYLLLSNQGGEVARCPDWGNALLARELDPQGAVGASLLVVDGWSWGDGDSLNCVFTDAACVGFQVGHTHYCSGLYAPAPSRVVIQMPEGYGTLRGAVGLQVHNAYESDGASFQVWQDDALLWESHSLYDYDPAEDMGAVAIHAGPVLLVTEPTGATSGDETAWVDLRVLPE